MSSENSESSKEVPDKVPSPTKKQNGRIANGTKCAAKYFQSAPEGRYAEFRCNGKSRHTGVRCWKWAEKGSHFCRFHGSRRKFINAGSAWKRLPVIYSKFLGPTLAERVQEFTKGPVQEQLSLYDELAVARGMLSQALELQKKVELAESMGKEITAGSKHAVQTAINEAMKNVGDMVDRIVKNEKAMEGNISITQLSFFVAQLTTIIFSVLGTKHVDLANELNEAIKTNLKLPANPQDEIAKHIRIVADMNDIPVQVSS